MPVDENEFRLAMGHFASGVTVVTTAANGERYGLTVASFASLSLRPPLVLVCIDKSVRTHDAILTAKSFAVNILGDDQEAVSRVFASRTEDKFASVTTSEGALGQPLIDGALAMIECSLHDHLPGGDHTIFVGQVEATRVRTGDPLAYFRSGYRKLA